MIKTIEHHIQNIASEQNSNVNSSEIFNHTVILLAEIRENIDYLILEQDDYISVEKAGKQRISEHLRGKRGARAA